MFEWSSRRGSSRRRRTATAGCRRSRCGRTCQPPARQVAPLLRLQRDGHDVVGRREPPAASRMQQCVVAWVIVVVRDHGIEHHAAEERAPPGESPGGSVGLAARWSQGRIQDAGRAQVRRAHRLGRGAPCRRTPRLRASTSATWNRRGRRMSNPLRRLSAGSALADRGLRVRASQARCSGDRQE